MFEHMDAWVSYLTMPVAVTLCFGPAVLVWWLGERRNKNSSGPAEKK